MPHKRHGRRRPYTSIGIERIPCVRCGATALHQWQICSDKRLYRPLCLACDIAVNDLLLRWMGDPDHAAKMKAYRAQQAKRHPGHPLCHL
jgi:hypothetical protein